AAQGAPAGDDPGKAGAQEGKPVLGPGLASAHQAEFKGGHGLGHGALTAVTAVGKGVEGAGRAPPTAVAIVAAATGDEAAKPQKITFEAAAGNASLGLAAKVAADASPAR